MADASTRCELCGSSLSLGVAHDLCPGCLLASALTPASEDRPTNPRDPSYRIVTILDARPDAEVFLALTQVPLPQYVTLELFHDRSDVDDVLSRFATWRKRLADLDHRHIGAVRDAGHLGGSRLFLASEYVAGASLRSIADGNALTADELAEVARELAAVLAAAHEHSVAHMNLTASCIRITRHPRLSACISDFGRALVLHGVDPDPEADRRALAAIFAAVNVIL